MKGEKTFGKLPLSLAALTLAVILMLVEIAGCGKKEVPAPPG